MTEEPFARATQNVGNLVALEHVNVTVPDQSLAVLFYVVGLGFTRDPYLMVGLENMWVNVGQQQLHLPVRTPQVVRGHIGVVVPDLLTMYARVMVNRNPSQNISAYQHGGDAFSL